MIDLDQRVGGPPLWNSISELDFWTPGHAIAGGTIEEPEETGRNHLSRIDAAD